MLSQQMNADPRISLNQIAIRTELRPGDIGEVTLLHGKLYHQEYQYGISFEAYVAEGLAEFYKHYNPARSHAWVCEHDERIVGFLALMDRGEAAQLRYFIIHPEYRGIGLGNKLMAMYMDFVHRCGYRSSYLWTTHELYAAAHLYKKFGFRLEEEKDSTAFGKPVAENKYAVYF